MTPTFDVVDAVPASASAAGDLRARFCHSLKGFKQEKSVIAVSIVVIVSVEGTEETMLRLLKVILCEASFILLNEALIFLEQVKQHYY